MLEVDPSIREEKIWEDFEEKGLCPEIKSLEDYRHQFSTNWPKAKELLIRLPTPIINPREFQQVHRTLFSGIYPWAGKTRGEHIMCRGRAGAPPENIGTELVLLEAQMTILLAEAKSKSALFRVAAFQHARLTTIQAFGDGNSRTSRAITDQFLTAITEKVRTKEMVKSVYFEALESALGKEDLAPLSDVLRTIYGEGKEKCPWIPSPFRTTNFPFDISMPRAINESFRQHPSILEEEYPKKLIWNRKTTWETVLLSVGGSITGSEPRCRQMWEEQQTVACTWDEFSDFLGRLERIGPTKKTLLGANPQIGWGEIRQSLAPSKKFLDGPSI
jgi:fido (protein-threonine AMPylation protein)